MSKASEWARRLESAEAEHNEARNAQPRFTKWEPGALQVTAWLTDEASRVLVKSQRAGEALEGKEGWINVEADTALALARWILDTFGDS